MLISVCGTIALVGCGDGDSSTTEAGGQSAATTAAESSGDVSGRTKPKVEVPEGAPPMLPGTVANPSPSSSAPAK